MTIPEIHRRQGYIESPNYPANYPPSKSCYCRLSTFRDSSIRIKLLDIRLTPGEGETCQSDWLEFRPPQQKWDSGRRLCDERLGTWIHTESNEVFIDFYADGEQEDRGFWLEYTGKSGLHPFCTYGYKRFWLEYTGKSGLHPLCT